MISVSTRMIYQEVREISLRSGKRQGIWPPCAKFAWICWRRCKILTLVLLLTPFSKTIDLCRDVKKLLSCQKPTMVNNQSKQSAYLFLSSLTTGNRTSFSSRCFVNNQIYEWHFQHSNSPCLLPEAINDIFRKSKRVHQYNTRQKTTYILLK